MPVVLISAVVEPIAALVSCKLNDRPVVPFGQIGVEKGQSYSNLEVGSKLDPPGPGMLIVKISTV
jgi:hypothetical protein